MERRDLCIRTKHISKKFKLILFAEKTELNYLQTYLVVMHTVNVFQAGEFVLRVAT